MDMNKTLVAYFSCTGTTRRAAQALAAAVDADVYEIRPQIPYTPADLDWRNKKSRSSVEMNDPGICRVSDLVVCGTDHHQYVSGNL